MPARSSSRNFLLRLALIAFGVEAPFQLMMPYSYLALFAIRGAGERRLVLELFAAVALVKTALLLLVLAHMLGPVRRWLRRCDAAAATAQREWGVPAEMLQRACLSAYRTPGAFASLWATTWCAEWVVVSAVLVELLPGRIDLGPAPMAPTIVVAVSCFFAALSLAYVMLTHLLAEMRGRASLALRERGLGIPPTGISLRRQLAVLILCVGVAPTGLVASLSYMGEVRGTGRSVEMRGRLATHEAATSVARALAAGVRPEEVGRSLDHGMARDAASAGYLFLIAPDGHLLTQQRPPDDSASLRAWALSSALRHASGSRFDPRTMRALSFRRLDGGYIVGTVMWARRPVPRETLLSLVFVSLIPVLWAALCGLYLAGAVARPLGSIAGAITRIGSVGADQQSGRVPVFTRDEIGVLAEAVNFLVDAQEEKQRLHHQIARERARLEAVIQEMPLGVVVAEEPSGRYVLWNKQLEAIIGAPIDRARLREQTAGLLPSRPDGARYAIDEIPLRRAVLAGETIRGEEISIVRADGGRRWLRVSAAPIRDAAGRLIAAVSALEDISDEKRAEEERSRTARFRELFLGILGHDLRSPMSTASIGIEHLLRSGLSPAQTRIARKVSASCSRMSRMVDQLLDLTRSRMGGGIAVRPAPMDLAALCRQVLAEMEVVHSGQRLELCAAGPVNGTWDPDRLSQVVTNLVGNALDHGEPGGRVRLTLLETDSEVTLEVHNRGDPIPAELLPVLFDPFRQGTAPRRSGRGLGLGLFIAQQIAIAHRGSIAVESSREQGTTFRVRLPRHTLAGA